MAQQPIEKLNQNYKPNKSTQQGAALEILPMTPRVKHHAGAAKFQ